jgi:1-deoxy-D-xylulose-5-phosphate reductoisomerase
MVEFADGAVIAQLGHPDMREPIQYALGYPSRLPLDNRKLDFASLASLSFYAPDTERFPALATAYEAISKGGNMPCIMNAANEEAVAAYLQDRIGFYGITDVVGECMAGVDFVEKPGLDDIFQSNEEARQRAREIIGKAGKRKTI